MSNITGYKPFPNQIIKLWEEALTVKSWDNKVITLL